MLVCLLIFVLFFFNDTATTEIYTLSLHDALPISALVPGDFATCSMPRRLIKSPTFFSISSCVKVCCRDRKSTRLNSSHGYISYAVFCLKKKKHTNSCALEQAHLRPST